MTRGVVAAALLALSCERYVSVGHADALVTDEDLGEQRGSPSTGQAAAGGAEGEAPGLWSADHETGDFEQWLSDRQGRRFVEGSGELEISQEYARSGSYSLAATLSATDGGAHQAVMGRDLSLAEGRYGAWYFLPVAPQTVAAVIMKLSNGGDVDRYDIDLEATDGDAPRLRLYEHESGGFLPEAATSSFPIGRWVRVEALYRSTPEDDGRVVVLQDGEQVLDSGARPTANDDRVVFFCGISSHRVAPAPFRLFIDDVSITPSAVP